MKIESLSIRAFGGGRKCFLRTRGVSFEFPFNDLLEFSDGIQDILAVSERLVPVGGGIRTPHREFLQIESVHVEDAGEYNKRAIPVSELKERRRQGQHLAGGVWYMELSINGTDSDCSFTTLYELFVLVQDIIRREIQNHGGIALTGMEVVTHALAS